MIMYVPVEALSVVDNLSWLHILVSDTNREFLVSFVSINPVCDTEIIAILNQNHHPHCYSWCKLDAFTNTFWVTIDQDLTPPLMNETSKIWKDVAEKAIIKSSHSFNTRLCGIQ